MTRILGFAYLAGGFFLACAGAAAHAQGNAALPDRPIVRQVASPMPVAPEATMPVPAAAANGPAIAPPSSTTPSDSDSGALTRALLAAQADGRRAGPMLPMLGPVATASWQRYLDSFTRPIPEWFRERVEAQTSN